MIQNTLRNGNDSIHPSGGATSRRPALTRTRNWNGIREATRTGRPLGTPDFVQGVGLQLGHTLERKAGALRRRGR
jgi:hypothetical protein